MGRSPYRAIGWAPFQWALPVAAPGDPLHPAGRAPRRDQASRGCDRRHRRSQTGLVVNDTSDFDRWVYFATPDEQSGKVWLSLFVAKDDLPAEYHMVPQFFLPGEVDHHHQRHAHPAARPPGAAAHAGVAPGYGREAAGLTVCLGVLGDAWCVGAC